MRARSTARSRRVLALPPEMRLFMCHDYGPNGRDIRWETTVAEQRAHNIHVRDGITEDEFVQMREARDATLAMPRLIIPSLQVNMRAGELPPPDETGKRFLKVPINAAVTPSTRPHPEPKDSPHDIQDADCDAVGLRSSLAAARWHTRPSSDFKIDHLQRRPTAMVDRASPAST